MQEFVQRVLAMMKRIAGWDLFFEVLFVVGVLGLFVWFWLADTF